MSKYRRQVPETADGMIDVYDVLVMFDVICPATQHAIKKLLCAGNRGSKGVVQDLQEAGEAINRAIELHRIFSVGGDGDVNT